MAQSRCVMPIGGSCPGPLCLRIRTRRRTYSRINRSALGAFPGLGPSTDGKVKLEQRSGDLCCHLGLLGAHIISRCPPMRASKAPRCRCILGWRDHPGPRPTANGCVSPHTDCKIDLCHLAWGSTLVCSAPTRRITSGLIRICSHLESSAFLTARCYDMWT